MATYVKPGQLGISVPFGELLGHSDAEMHEELKDYQSIGVDWVRMDFHWDLVQPAANSGYNWGLIDKVVNATNGYGIEVVAILEGVPDWAGHGFSSSSAQQAYGGFARAAAEHFGNRVDYWEIMSEPNKDGISPINYTKGLKLASSAIRSVDSSDMVITGGLSPVPNTDSRFWGATDYLEQMYANGAKNYFDAVGFNPYSWPLMPDDSAPWNGWQIMEDGIRDTMVANGDSGKQVWMNEFGAPTYGGGSSVSESKQAAMLAEAVDLAQDLSWVGPLMYYSYKDRGGNTSSTENWFGLIASSGRQKEAYHTYKSLATQDNGSGSGSSSGSDSGSGGSSNAGSSSSGEGVYTYTNSPTNARITDFQSGDKIDLSAVDADTTTSGNQDFDFIGSSWLKEAGDLGVYKNQSGNFTEIQAYRDNDKKYDLKIRLDGIHDLDENDFILSDSNVFKITSTPQYASIKNFSEGDVIDLSAIDADSTASGNQAFTFVGSKWLKDAGELGFYISGSGNATDVKGDLNGDTIVDFTIVVSGLHDLTSDNFIL